MFVLSNLTHFFLKSCTWGNYQIDWRLFTYMKHNYIDYFYNIINEKELNKKSACDSDNDNMKKVVKKNKK